MSDWHSDQDDQNSSNVRSRRSILATGAVCFGALAMSEAGSAKSSNNNSTKEQSEITSSNHDSQTNVKRPISRAEKAAQEGKEWNEDWINEERINETWAEDNQGSQSNAYTTLDMDSNSLGGQFGVGGITITIEGYFADCEGWIELGALGQTARGIVTCTGPCYGPNINAGAATIDGTLCYDWENREINGEFEGCVWHLWDWSCQTATATIS